MTVRFQMFGNGGARVPSLGGVGVVEEFWPCNKKTTRLGERHAVNR